MRIPPEPRYYRTKKYANRFLLEYKFSELPINPLKIIKDHKWALVTYSDLMDENNCTRKVLKSLSEDGFTSYNGRNYTIAYDESIRSSGRIKWTLMHEIAHIYLDHFIDFKQTTIRRGSLRDDEYDILEKEAHYFTKNVLAPLIILNRLKVKSPVMICKIAGLSDPAARNRYNDFLIWKDKPKLDIYELTLLTNFYNFIHKKHCITCGHSFVIEDAKYCPVCGKRRIYWGDGKMIYDDGFEVDENGRAIQCPRCGNEETEFDGNHCIICGTYMVNKCAETQVSYYDFTESCGTTLPGNARYCYNCGNISTFYRDKLLKTWNHVHLTQQVASAQEDENDVPF
ncbi:MAG TPA: ImmA/IrrE family metallo-endopeptidase [Desulfitobacterium dehalogenans]|uniref:ImmA/IrrE family metallo-endopeptidase n=1 Tax=Desulfitobacterium dehalogenans TaxID=36854 RepID=A0A7C7D514_9FIRM|nr:ImmA/IrrE family metallo-endopeptidase [Desulfitobacterium dehalogenans]